MVKNSDIASIIDISLFKTKYPQSISLPPVSYTHLTLPTTSRV